MFKKLQLTLLLAVLISAAAFAQSRTVVGVVTDAETGEPLPGVTVVVLNTTRGTSTDADGRYSIRAASDDVLRFSFISYASQEITVGDQTEINVALGADVQNLDELVVTGYGALNRRQITGAIGQVSSEDFKDVSIQTADQALQGRVAGVQLSGTSGVLGAPTQIRIRGASSISASTAPLVVVDGVPITNPTSAGITTVGAGAGGQGINPLINLNPADIESYEVLKDASAAALFGSRGSNGVILITTKKGKQGQQNIAVNYYAGFTNETNRYDMMNGEQFTEIWNAADANRFGGVFALPTTDIESTDWVDEIRQTGFVQEANASVSGGNATTQYFISGTFRSEEGYTEGNELDRFAARVRVDHALSDNVRVGLSINPTRTENNRTFTSNAVAAPFTYGALYFPNVAAFNDDGTPNTSIAPNPFGQFPGTPITNIQGTDFSSVLQQVITSADVAWNINENFSANANFTVDLFQLNEIQKRGANTTDGFPTGQGIATNTQFRNYNLNTTVEYRNNFGDNAISAIVGFSAQESVNDAFNSSGINFANDQLKTLNSAAEITGGGGTGTSFAFLGYLGRVNYTYKDKYILTVSGRYDGSSRFGEDEQFGFFPAASAGWIASDEDFLAENDILDFLKVRVSWGQTGNAEIGNFPSLGLIGFGLDYNGQPGGRLTQLANAGLRWETTTQTDLGIDYGFLNSRIRGTIGLFIKETEDLLLNAPVSGINGFTTFTDNIGAIENRGVEFDVTADILQSGDFTWTSSFNISSVANEVTELVDVDGDGNGDDQIFGRNLLREGEELGAFFLVRYNGVDETNGDALYLDIDGNSTSAFSNNDRVIAGSPFPDFFGGFTNTFAYKGVDLNVFFQYSVGNDIYRSDGRFTDTNLSSVFNQAARQSDFWTPQNTTAANPRPILLANNGRDHSTRYLEDGSFLRLKSLTLGYTLPANVTKGFTARLFAQGTNLLTFDDFEGLDPEAVGGGNIQAADVFFQPPQQRTITFGVNLNF